MNKEDVQKSFDGILFQDTVLSVLFGYDHEFSYSLEDVELRLREFSNKAYKYDQIREALR